MLVQCAWAAKRKKGSYSRAQFFRIQSKRGPQKAICAVAASLLTAIYHMLKHGVPHHDLGADYFDRRPPELKAKRLVAQLAKLGFTRDRQQLMRKSGRYYCVTYLLPPLKLLSFSEMSISEKCESFQWGESFCDSVVPARLARDFAHAATLMARLAHPTIALLILCGPLHATE